MPTNCVHAATTTRDLRRRTALLATCLVLALSQPRQAVAQLPTGEDPWTGLAFDRAAFDEVVTLAEQSYLLAPLPDRAWISAAVGALRSQSAGAHLLPADFWAEQPSGEVPPGGTAEPLACPALAEGLVVWRPGQGGAEPATAAAYRLRNQARRDFAQKARQAWTGRAFGRPGLDCVMAMVLAAGPTAESPRIWRHAAEGFLHGLDPHTTVVPTSLFRQQERSSRASEFVDVGLDFHQRDDLTVRRVWPGGPAARFDIRSGDRLLAVDGDTTLTLAQANGRLQGKPGTSVQVTLQRGNKKPRTFTLVRQAMRYPSVTGWLTGTGVGVVRVPQFAADAALELDKAMAQLRAEAKADGGLRALVLDLRGNTGGWVEQAVAVADRFLSPGRHSPNNIIATVRSRTEAPQIYRATARRNDIRLPVVVLVDPACRSACELLAAALQDHERALVVGQPTFGKGSVQEVIAATLGPWSVIVTIARYLAPSGRSLQALGVTPDIAVAVAGPAALREADAANSLAAEGEVPPHACRLVTAPLRRCAEGQDTPTTGWQAQWSREDPAVAGAVSWARCLGGM